MTAQDPQIELDRVMRKIAAATKKRKEALEKTALLKISEEEIKKAHAVQYFALTTSFHVYHQWRVTNKIGWDCLNKIQAATMEELTDGFRAAVETTENPQLILFSSWKYVEEAYPELIKTLRDKATHVYYTRHHKPMVLDSYIVGWRSKKSANPGSYGRTFSVRLDPESADKLTHITEKILPPYSTASETLRFLVEEYKFPI